MPIDAAYNSRLRVWKKHTRLNEPCRFPSQASVRCGATGVPTAAAERVVAFHFAVSVARLSRITVTLISPG